MTMAERFTSIVQLAGAVRSGRDPIHTVSVESGDCIVQVRSNDLSLCRALREYFTVWLTDDDQMRQRIAMLQTLKAEHARPGASARAAEYIWNVLRPRSSPIAAPHFVTASEQRESLVAARGEQRG